MRRLKLPAATLTAAAVIAGCGGSDDDDQASTLPDDHRAILSTIDDLQSASRRGDTDRICDELFTEALANSIADASRHTCQAEVQETFVSPDAQISVGREIQVEGSRATAVVREQNGNASTLFLVKGDDRWRIERVKPLRSQ